MTSGSTINFTSDEERLIQQMIKEKQDRERQMMIDAEIRNRLLNAQSQQPGYRYY